METSAARGWYSVLRMNQRPLLALLVAALLLLCAGGAWLLLRGDAPRSMTAATPPPAVAASAGAEDTGALEEGRDAAGALDGQHLRAQGIPVGVRLGGPGRLEGRVIERSSGLGVPHARVDLLPVPPAAQTFLGQMLRMAPQTAHMSNRVKPVAVAETDASGAFRFEGVRTGSWFVDARGPYHVPETTLRARVLASGAGGPLDVFVVAGGRVLGTVFAPDGTPAARAKVVLVAGPGNFITTLQNGDLRQLECDCDARGEFVFEGVPTGAGWELSAIGSGFALSHTTGLKVLAGQDTHADVHARLPGRIRGRVLSVPGKDGGGEAEPVALAEAHLGAIPRGLRDLRCAEEILERTHCTSAADGSFVMENVPPGEVDLVAIAWGHLPAIGAHLDAGEGGLSEAPDIQLARGPVISGRVIDAAGNPLEGVEMSWNLVDWRNFQFDFSFAPMMAAAVKGIPLPKTGADGRFRVGPVAGDAPWKVDFQKLGYVDGQLSFDPAKDGAPEKSDVTVTLHRGGALEGVVMDELAAEPVQSFTITTGDRVDTEEDAPGGRNPFSGGISFEDPAGRFRLDSLRPGKVHLTVSAPGFPDTSVEDLEVVEGGVQKGVIVKLHPGATLRGRVEDADGKPVAGAQVVVVPEGGQLRAAPGMREESQRRRQRRGGRGPFGGGAGGPFGTGDSFPPALLGFAANLGMLGERSFVSRGDGSFEILGADAGHVRVQAFHREYAWGASPPVETVAGRALDGVVVTMHEGGGLEGKVSDRHGRALPQAIVAAFSPAAFAGMGASNAGGLYEGETDAQGAYEIRHMTPGSYFVVVTRGDQELNPLSFFGTLNFDLVTVPEDEVVRYDLVDAAAGACRVFGRVRDGSQPVTRGMLSAVRFDGESVLGVEFKVARLDTQGRYEFAGLAPGDYQLNLDGQSGGQVRMALEVPDASELELDLELPHGAIEGLVLDEATNAPVVNAEVMLEAGDAPQSGGLLGSMISRDGRVQRKRSDEKGVFRFERLRSASYTLSARGPREGEARGSYAPSQARRIEVDERRTERDVELRLSPALTLEGVVKDARGAAVEGANVLATPEGAAGAFAERAKSGADGRYVLRGLAPGKYAVSASVRDFADFEKKGIELQRQPGKTNTLDIVLQKGVLVRLRVRDALGRPVSGAHAQLARKGAAGASAGAERMLTSFFSDEGSSDEDGKLELGRYSPGQYRLEVQRGFSRATRDPLEIKGGQDEDEIEIDLP